MTSNTITGNNSGGIYLSDSGYSTLTSNTITGNKSNTGGGIYFQSSGGCMVRDNTITGNTADTGGAIYFEQSSECIVRDNEITGNHTTSPNQTGGIYISDSPNVNFAGDPVNGIFNRIHDNDGCDIRNTMSYQPNGSNDILATNVWWGTCDEFALGTEICDFFDDTSKGIVLYFSVNPPGSFAQCPGGDDPGCDDCDGDMYTNACEIGSGSPDSDGDGIPDDCCDAFPPTITTTSPLPNGAVGIAYDQTMQAEADCGSVEWGIVTGALPAGLNLVAATGRIHGTPTEAGTFLFRLSATEANDLSAELDFAHRIQAPIGTLAVTPGGTLASEGYEFGPFTPLNRTYTLRNVGSTPITWTAAKGQPWVLLSRTAGSLQPIGAAGDTVFVTVSIDAVAVDSFLPGPFNDTVTFTNTTNARGNTSRGVSLTVLSAQPTPGQDTQPGNEVTLDHLWQWDETLDRFAPPPNNTVIINPTQPTYLLTHGWDGDLNAPTQSMSSIGCAIYQVLPNANLLAWDWSADANPNGISDFEELSFLGKLSGLLGFLEANIFFDSLTAAYFADESVGKAVADALHSAKNAQYQGIILGRKLADELGRQSLGSELHLIGKSHGGGVMGQAAQTLKNRGFPVDSLTTLDSPQVLCEDGNCLIDSLANVIGDSVKPAGQVVVYYYGNRLLGGMGAPVLGNFATLSNLSLQSLHVPVSNPIAHLWISGFDDGCPSDEGWFPEAIHNNDPSLDSFLTFEGLVNPTRFVLMPNQFVPGNWEETLTRYRFQFAANRQSETEEVVPTYLRGSSLQGAQGLNFDDFGMSLLAYEPFLSATSWSGSLVELVVGSDPNDATNRGMLLAERGDASFFKDIVWQANAIQISFDYLFHNPRGGESLTVYINDEIVYFDSAEISLAGVHLTSSGPIYVGDVAGTTARLNFILRTDQPEGGTLDGSVLIDNIRVFGFVKGDGDRDADRDLADVSVLQGCFEISPIPDGCRPFDANGNDVVDLSDYRAFYGQLSGPTLPPIP